MLSLKIHLNPLVGSTAHPEQQQFLLLVEQLRQLERAWDLSSAGGMCGHWRLEIRCAGSTISRDDLVNLGDRL